MGGDMGQIVQDVAGPAIVGLLLSLAVSIALILTESLHARFSHDHTVGVQKFHLRPVPGSAAPRSPSATS